MNMYDALADYLGGALDGTPEEQAVAARIASDPAWRAAYEELLVADVAVRSDLSAFAAEPVELPADVAARISAALVAESGPVPAVVPPAARRRSRWALAGGAFAVTIVALGGVGLLLDQTSDDTSVTAGKAATQSDQRAAGPASPTGPSAAASSPEGAESDYGPPGTGVQTLASGRNYTAGQIKGLLAPGVDAQATYQHPPRKLDPLRERALFDACMKAVQAIHGGKPTKADYARYEGSPALVITLDGGDSATVIVGPACGTGGADEIYPTPSR
ncbi:hypothetical protein Lfu02_23510 [Longispora fulva]|uniref:Negative regulator of sigma E activity n=1 Tax=Longispora fulva TaxID=619741 RepID=A0A8J7KLQ6_9ACTN|nr:hypothetical protein [Longispora fulva]MBG6139639.1 negative regulator of sigma E activity [Longispora fulva]GIG57979.1 hypothetical protein Lfu02_23510 [Longispora fulva]